MPIFDHRCQTCHHVFEGFAWPSEVVPCRMCGAPTEHIWLPGRPPHIVGDSMDQVIENLGPTPKRYRSRSELRRDMEAAGLKPFVRHVGEQGSDKSKHTVRWI